jgi:hypothetical protein
MVLPALKGVRTAKKITVGVAFLVLALALGGCSSRPELGSVHGRVVLIAPDGRVFGSVVPSILIVKEASPAHDAVKYMLKNPCDLVEFITVGAAAAVAGESTWSAAKGEGSEEGRFEFRNLAPGQYIFLAHGQIGPNRAIWETIFHISGGRDVSLTVSELHEVCK